MAISAIAVSTITQPGCKSASLSSLASVTQTAPEIANATLLAPVSAQFPEANSSIADQVASTDELAPGQSFGQSSAHTDTQALLSLVSSKLEASPSERTLGNQFEDSSSTSPDHSTTPGHERLRHAGTKPANFRDLTQSDLLGIALQQSSVIRSLGVRVLDSPASVATVYDTAIQSTDPFLGPAAALAEFDSQITSSLTSQNNDLVFNNTTLGGDVQELVQDFAQFDSSWQKRTTLGTVFDMRRIVTYDSNNRAGNNFPSFWETQFELGIRQPLLRGAGRNFNLIAGPNAQPGFNFSNGIWIARINTQISQADFEIRLRDYFLELYTAYWELRRQYQAYESITKARDVAHETWQIVRSKMLSGLTGGEAYKEAQARAQYYRYVRETQLTLGGGGGASGLYNAERSLRQLIGLPANDGWLLRPIDDPAAARFEFDVDASIARAIGNRTELRRQRLEVQQHKLRSIAAKNFLLPQLDMIGRTRVRGFGDDLTGGGPRFASASDDFYSFDHQEWQFGLEMNVSPARRQAKAGVRNACLQLQRERAIMREQERAVTFEIQEAIAEVQSSYLAMESSKARLEAAQQRLQSSEALYDAGKIQLEFLIDAADDLLQSETQLAVDQSRYSLALVRVSRSSGTLLSDVGVHSR